MANRLRMATAESILRLHAQGWSQRRIARELRVDRKTVRRHLRRARRELAEGAGGEPSEISKGATAPTGSGAELRSDEPGRSDCEPYRALILAKLAAGLSAQRIYQDLVGEHGFTARYWSVRRFVQALTGGPELPVRRMEVEPGQDAQVDFGTGAPIVNSDGKRRKTYVFRIVLSHSRKGYSEATFTQTAEDFIRCLENAFAHFGGVTRTLTIDNLKAAVAHPDWFDPELNPKLAAFARHYGIVILPTRPYKPEHKGKVEAGVKYVQNNGLKGHTFATLEAQNRHLAEWERTVADTRIHGTTKRQVQQVFQSVERAALRPLPLERFPFFHEAQRKVSRDGHVEVAKAYYSVPPEYLGRTVWVRWDARLVRIFNRHWEQVALHVRHEKGRFSTQAAHLPREKISGLEKGAAWLLGKIEWIGPHTHAWSEAMLTARGIEGTRVLQGVLSLSHKHPTAALENACQTALSYGAFRLRTLRALLKRDAAKQTVLPFLSEHPLIRPLSDYSQVVTAALVRQEDRRRLRGEGLERHDWAKERPGGPSPGCQGAAEVPPPRSGYPLSGCSPAEPDSVSPDKFNVVGDSVSHQELPHE